MTAGHSSCTADRLGGPARDINLAPQQPRTRKPGDDLNREYFDCELPSVRRVLEDPEAFLQGLRGKRVVLGEVHRLPNPSGLLKIAADHFPTVRILATGSSTQGASRRFRDTLSGRKTELWLTPMIEADLRVTTPDARPAFTRGYSGVRVQFLTLDRLVREVNQSHARGAKSDAGLSPAARR